MIRLLVWFLLSTIFFLLLRPPPSSTLFPYTTLFRSDLNKLKKQHPEASLLVLSEYTYTDALPDMVRSEEHTSELQSRFDLVCRLLLEKKILRTSVLKCNEGR